MNAYVRMQNLDKRKRKSDPASFCLQLNYAAAVDAEGGKYNQLSENSYSGLSMVSRAWVASIFFLRRGG